MTTNTDRHVPVLVQRIVDLFKPAVVQPDPVIVDGTLGLGGHSAALLATYPQLRVIGIDRDSQAREIASGRLAAWADRVTIVAGNFHELPGVLADQGITSVSGVLLDLGLSSLQIDRAERGFAYRVDAPLDMRMSPEESLTAADVLNTYSEDQLAAVLREFGEERFAKRIASRIVEARQAAPIVRSGELVALIHDAIPRAAQKGGHPAKRTFQALRMEVNQELDSLRAVVPAVLKALRVGGRFCCLAYHSGEDRIIKRAFTKAATDAAPDRMPIVPNHLRAQFRLVVAEKPTAKEIEQNPRAASARLRAIERVREAA